MMPIRLYNPMQDHDYGAFSQHSLHARCPKFIAPRFQAFPGIKNQHPSAFSADDKNQTFKGMTPAQHEATLYLSVLDEDVNHAVHKPAFKTF